MRVGGRRSEVAARVGLAMRREARHSGCLDRRVLPNNGIGDRCEASARSHSKQPCIVVERARETTAASVSTEITLISPVRSRVDPPRRARTPRVRAHCGHVNCNTGPLTASHRLDGQRFERA